MRTFFNYIANICRSVPKLMLILFLGFVLQAVVVESSHAQITPVKTKQKDKKKKAKKGEKAHKGDIAGRKLRKRKTKGRSESVISRKAGKNRITPRTSSPAVSPKYATVNPYAGRKRYREGERFGKYKSSIGIRSTSGKGEKAGKRRKVYTGKKRPTERAFKGDIAGRKLRKNRSPERSTVIPSSDPYRGRKRTGDKAYSGNIKPTRRVASKPSERAWKKDIAGRKLTKRGSSSKRKNVHPVTSPFANQKPKGDRAYKGRIQPSRITATRPSEKAWKNDIAGKPLFNKNRSSKRKNVHPVTSPFANRKPKGDRPYTGRRLTSRPPGDGTKQGAQSGGRGKKTYKGGGSISGRSLNNKGRPITQKSISGQARVASVFSGKQKGLRKPLKGGGSISGRSLNNKGRPITQKSISGQARIASVFQGKQKGLRKPLKGGGSISGRSLNNKGRPITQKSISGQARIASVFQGKQKGLRKPLKGGGSISGRSLNNKGRPITQKSISGQARIASVFKGKQKGPRKAIKGGGSISGRSLNNKGRPITQKSISGQARIASVFQGKQKGPRKAIKGGGSISGRSLNNKGRPITQKSISGQARIASVFKGKQKGPRKAIKGGGSITRSWNNRGRSVTRKSISPETYFASVSIGKTKFRPKAIGEAPGSTWKGRYKRFDLQPGYKNEKISAYSGNIKMKRSSIKDKHPSAQYTSGKRKSSTEEKEKTFKFKLWFNKLFKKNSNQPDNLKEKPKRRPRYDKREKDLWYD